MTWVKIFVLTVAFFVFDTTALLAAGADGTDPAFSQKLISSLQTADKSIKLLQQQIVQSQSAPFLPDLYLQLAELHSDKSTTLYFIQRERQKDLDNLSPNDKAFAPVIEEQQEAIKIYRLVLKDFPSYEKKKIAIFRLCIALKSIDENAAFAQSASQLLKLYPGSEQASSIRLILGLQLLEQQNYADARQILLPVTSRPFAYERNMARYRLGLVDLGQAKFRSALNYFEQVINDPELKAEEDSSHPGLKNRPSGKTDLKREALVASIRAYTYVFEKDAHPVEYYGRLAPNEPLFREAIEKLAQRYIELKQIPMALDLLRNVAKHTNDPQKALNIYRQVLVLLPRDKRAEFPPEEMRYVLEQYVAWSTDYLVSSKLKQEVADFLEKQVREMATSLHQASQSMEANRKQAVLRKASEFYKVYLAIFRNNAHTSDMATDLADVYFAQNNYLKSGEYYLQLFQGKFGRIKDRRSTIENAILCLQKKSKFSFYETVRMRGLLIASIESYLVYDKTKRRDPNLNFLLVKSRYDQGFFPDSISELYAFIRRFKNTPQAGDAAEIILDYFNTQSDFASLISYGDKLLALKIPNKALNDKITRIRVQANSKEIHEKIRSLAGYNDFEQGKSYLDLALSSPDAATKNLVLREALTKSQNEGDIQTFLKVATLMLEKESAPEKKQEILLSLAQETTRVSQYYQAVNFYRQIYRTPNFSEENKVSAVEQALQLGLVLRDWAVVQDASNQPFFAKASAPLKKQLEERILDYLDSPLPAPPALVSRLVKMEVSDGVLLVLFRAQQKLSAGSKNQILGAIAKRCSVPKGGALCAWFSLAGLDQKKELFLKKMQAAAPTLESIQSLAGPFSQIEADYRRNAGSDDPFLESVLSLRSYELFSSFARFLKNTADKNPNLKAVLDQKVTETLATAKMSLNRCREINEKSTVIHSAINDCYTGVSRPLTELLKPLPEQPYPPDGTDRSGSPKIENLKKTLFSSRNNQEAALKLSRAYLEDKKFGHAAALATYGVNLYKDHEREFKIILGCSVLSLGYLSEANYNLSDSAAASKAEAQGQNQSDEALRMRCLAQVDYFKNRENSRKKL
jgi:hypothetical protein